MPPGRTTRPLPTTTRGVAESNLTSVWTQPQGGRVQMWQSPKLCHCRVQIYVIIGRVQLCVNSDSATTPSTRLLAIAIAPRTARRAIRAPSDPATRVRVRSFSVVSDRTRHHKSGRAWRVRVGRVGGAPGGARLVRACSMDPPPLAAHIAARQLGPSSRVSLAASGRGVAQRRAVRGSTPPAAADVVTSDVMSRHLSVPSFRLARSSGSSRFHMKVSCDTECETEFDAM